MSRNEHTPRSKLREVITKCQRGPTFSFAAFGEMTSHQEELCIQSVRLWLDSWIVPQLLDVEAKLFKPTAVELLVFEKHLSAADRKTVAALAEELAEKFRRPAARNMALVELFIKLRREKKETK